MNLTYEEQERLAYVSGDTQKAALLGALVDQQGEIFDLEDELSDAKYHYECPSCGYEE